MQNGSPAAKLTWAPGRVKSQFMVKVLGIQSLSTMPESGTMPSLGEFTGPDTQRL